MLNILNSIKVKLLKKFKITEEPYDIFKFVFNDCIRFYAGACGCDILTPAFRYNIKTFMFVTSTALFGAFSCSTIYTFEDQRDRVKSMITFPFGLQVIQKALSIKRKHNF